VGFVGGTFPHKPSVYSSARYAKVFCNFYYGNTFINAGGIRVKEASNIYCFNNYFENSIPAWKFATKQELFKDYREDCNFYDLADYFLNTLGCKNAIYSDGNVIQAYVRDSGKGLYIGENKNIAPLILVTKK
jgi:hypothetical protein